jgi:putative redox protein
MGQVNVTWVKDFTFVGTDSTNHSVVISSPKDDVGVKPSELLLVSLGACTSYDVVNILTKKRAKITGLQVAVSGEQDEDPPWTFRKLHIHYRISGANLKLEDVEKAIQLSEEKYCSVSATLKHAAEITYDVEVVETGA